MHSIDDDSVPRGSRLRFHAASWLVTGAALLGGCASYGPGGLAPGSTETQIAASMGQPTGRYTMPDGHRRLEYARGPMGVKTYMLDLDTAGQLKSSTQVLDENHFDRILPGMSRDELLRTIGRPSETREISFQKVSLWNYRFENTFCVWFQVDIDQAGKVRDVGYGPDPLCTPMRF